MAKRDVTEVRIECPECQGTGLYSGPRKIRKIGIICKECGGEGWKTLEFKPFAGKKPRRGIDNVYSYSSKFVPFFQEGLTGGVPYRAFLKGKIPNEPDGENEQHLQQSL